MDSPRSKHDAITRTFYQMFIIDIETGDYEVDKNGLQAAKRLNARHENTRLFGIRIGYNIVASFGGVMERVNK
ncbi:hypothetical protein [Chamaesiphon sp.]|uniref:hypothetical protein n=1 Tax=Chamaesiphon sp. TaxID=2814140 RepID=UPI003593D12D